MKINLKNIYEALCNTDITSVYEGDYPVDHVTTKQEAIDVAYAELSNNSPYDFSLEVEEIDD